MAPANCSNTSLGGSRSIEIVHGWPAGVSNRSGGIGNGDESAGNMDGIPSQQSSMIAEKQAELDQILHDHDAMIRELFHLEKFVTLLGFDPKVAKEDNSAVFQEYKAGYDLLNKASESSSSASRTTRRSHTQRIMNIKGSSVGSSSVAGKDARNAMLEHMPSISASAKGKERAVNGDKPHVALLPEFSVRGNLSGKGKGKMFTSQTRTPPNPSRALERLNTTSSHHGSSRVFSDETRKRHISDGASVSAMHSSVPASKKRRVTGSFSGTLGESTPHFTQSSHRLSRHVSMHSSHGHALNNDTSPNRSKAKNTADDRSAAFLSPYQKQESLVSPKPSIKRIKLIVRRPPPSITHPLHRPPPKKFDSLHAFLSSYITIDNQDVQEQGLQEIAKKQSLLLDRADTLRKTGRAIFDTEVFEGIVGSNNLYMKEPTRTVDHWDNVVEAIVSRPRNGRSNGRQIALQIANKIQSYWDHHSVREDKAKAQEEKRLRALAKATIKMVTNEWKKAVFHIREQERKRAEKEEMIRGHEHLDAILDQSGQILETQQVELAKGDLSRSRSRSSSVSGTLRDWASDPDDWEGSDLGEASDDEEAATPEVSRELTTEREEDTSSAGEDEDEDISALALLGENDTSYRSQRATDEESVDMALPSQEQSESEPDLDDYQDTPQAAEEDSKNSSPPSMLFDIQSPPRHTLLPPANQDAEQDVSHEVHSTPMPASGSPASSDDHDADPVLSEKEVDDSLFFEADITMNTDDKSTDLAEDQAMAGDNSEISSADVSLGNTQVLLDQATPAEDGLPTSPVHVDSREGTTPHNDSDDEDEEDNNLIPEYLKRYAVAPIDWNTENKVKAPILLRGVLRPYQQSGLEWLASLHVNNLNGILADEMGLGKTIQTIALLAHLACDRGIWGPHLIIVPTSVLLNWEMEFKKFLPGFKILSYHGTTKRRKELRQGWYNKHHFNVCITSYTLASRDAHIFRRKAWYYMILDEAHMIKNFKSQRWNILLMFRSFRRLLLTGTPLQNNLTELWALLQFLMSGTNFANLKEFGEWFSNPLEKAIEMGTVLDDENMQRVTKLHTVLRPYLLRRLKRDVEKELPSKYEHLVLCHLSKRQRFLYDEFMSRAQTRDALHSGVYQKIANILMQLRKVCNHPDLFEVRPIVTSFAMQRSAIADFEVKELLIRRRMFRDTDDESLDLDLLGLRFAGQENTSMFAAIETRRLDATSRLPFVSDLPGEPPPRDNRTIQGFRAYQSYQQRAQKIARWTHMGYLNHLRCNWSPVVGREMLATVRTCYRPLLPLSAVDLSRNYLETTTLSNAAVKSYSMRAEELCSVIDNFVFVTPPVVALDLPRIALSGFESKIAGSIQNSDFDSTLHRASVKLQIAFPNPSLLQYDCGKLQELARLLRERKAGGHRALIFTQMTRILDILEIFLNFHGYLYLRLDGATKIEDRQYITERFNVDTRIFCFISSSRSGGVGINLTGADTVIFYDSDFNPQMDRQCEDRAHRIGQIRDVHIYRFISSHTVEEAMLLKANQKRSLDDLVIQKGEFDWRSLFEEEGALSKALGEFEDTEDAHAAAVAAREAVAMEGADEADFGAEGDVETVDVAAETTVADVVPEPETPVNGDSVEIYDVVETNAGGDAEDDGGTIDDYMVAFVHSDYEFFRDWRL